MISTFEFTIITYICVMKNSIFLLALFGTMLLLTACKTDVNTAESEIEPDEVPAENLTFDERLKRQITGHLSIPATEKYSTEIIRGFLNSDNIEDAVITINRLEYAKEQVAKAKNSKQIEEFGYMGNYNYFVFYDGKLDKLSVPIPVPSSAIQPLNAKLENITSEAHKDLTLEYRIYNAGFKNYYQISQGTLIKIFQVKLFDYLGTATPEAFHLEYKSGSISNAKDIEVFAGRITNYDPIQSASYDFVPQIEKTSKRIRNWFYNPQIQKYMTEDPTMVE